MLMLVLKYISLKKDMYNVQYYKMIRRKKTAVTSVIKETLKTWELD